jgi:hypothetical protein
VKTKKGFHFYFKRCKEFPKSKIESAGLGFDMPSLLYAPPGYYETDKERVEYKLVKGSFYGEDHAVIYGTNYKDLTEEDNSEVVEMPQEIIDEIKRLLNTKNKTNTKTNQMKPVVNVNTNVNVNSRNNQFQKYKEFLVLIQGRNQEYEDWRNVGFALHTISDCNEMYEVFAEWSQVDYPNFDETYTQKFWNNCKGDRDSRITFGTLVHWAKEDNPEGYKEWNNIWGLGKLKHLVNNFDHSETGKYFKHIRPNNFVYKDNQGWWMLQDDGRWRFSKEATGFINTICDTIKKDLNKLRNHYSGKMTIINEQIATAKTNELIAKHNYCSSIIETVKKCSLTP